MIVSDAVTRLKAIFESAVDGIIIIDHKGTIEEVNIAACRQFGYEKSELIGNKVNMLMQAEQSAHHDKYINNYQETRTAKIIGIGREVVGKRKDGEIFPFWLSVNEVVLQDRTIFTGFIHDLTDIKSAEKSLKQLNEELEKKVIERTYELESVVNRLLALNKQNEIEIQNRIATQTQLKQRELELEQSLAKEKELGELKSRFVSMASHEFRTPLSTILSSVSLIGRYTETAQQENRDKHILKIKSSVTHLTGILNDFLSMNKLEEGKTKPIFEDFDICELIKEITEELKTIVKQGQTLQTICTFDQKIVRSDVKIVKNIMINLISNAIKYSPENAEILCNLDRNGNEISFSVIDKGIGIPDDEQKHLFDRFFRASNVTNIEGTGLGLNIVKGYVEILGGNISFESTRYVGSKFTITIPDTNHS
ncbi:MAG TPA: PAS domain-containing sensor histidine kinase [Saprospiraceae bacterium]|nr:PAS domain-containing sensor histidine kinase [Saprospiraceae bacterium]